MKHTPFILAFAAILLLSGLVSPVRFVATAQAQERLPRIGDAAPYLDQEGVEVGSITVTDVVDPAVAVAPNEPAEPGSRYLLVTFTVEATADVRFDLDPYQILVQTTDGTLWDQTLLQPIADAAIPPLTNQALAPGSRISGTLAYTLPADSILARVLYQPSANRYVTLATIAVPRAPALGESVEITDAEGGTSEATVTEVVDPFLDHDPSTPPEPGTRYVAAVVAVENTSDGRFTLDSFPFAVADTDGSVWSSTFLSRPADQVVVPDLVSRQLAPGDRVSGAIFFAVPEDAKLAGVILQPSSDQLLPLADLTAGRSGALSAAGTPAAGEDEDADDS